ncbi:hypothetical protein IW262DRAFT_1415735 [Armillaria fumosa]|nr:hypothetical protein IW262DRAFT_1415735 [Armillaria fumosa]
MTPVNNFKFIPFDSFIPAFTAPTCAKAVALPTMELVMFEPGMIVVVWVPLVTVVPLLAATVELTIPVVVVKWTLEVACTLEVVVETETGDPEMVGQGSKNEEVTFTTPVLCGPAVAVEDTAVITTVELEIEVPLLPGTVTVIIPVVWLLALAVVVGKAKVVVLAIAVPLLAGSVMVVMTAVVVGTAKVVVTTDELEITGHLAAAKEEVTVKVVALPRDVVLLLVNTKEEDDEAAVEVDTSATDENTTAVALLGLESVTVVGVAPATVDDTAVDTGKNTEVTGELSTMLVETTSSDGSLMYAPKATGMNDTATVDEAKARRSFMSISWMRVARS